MSVDHVLLDRQGQRDLPAALSGRSPLADPEPLRGDEEPDLPERLPPAQPEAIERADRDQVLDRIRADRAAADEIGQRAVRAVRLPLEHDPPGRIAAERLDVGQPDPDPVAILDRAADAAQVDIRREDPHPVPLGVVDQHVRGVEAHRLVVEQRADELGRVVVLQPARLIGQHGEGGGVRLREAVRGEAEQLPEDRRARSRR